MSKKLNAIKLAVISSLCAGMYNMDFNEKYQQPIPTKILYGKKTKKGKKRK